MINFFFYFIILLIMNVVSAEEIAENGKLEFTTIADDYFIGDVVQVKFSIYPFKDEHLFNLKKILSGDLFGFLNVVEVHSVSRSKNNFDYVEIVFDAIIFKRINLKNFLIWNYSGRNIPIDISHQGIIKSTNRLISYNVIASELGHRPSNNYLLFILFGLLLIVLFSIDKIYCKLLSIYSKILSERKNKSEIDNWSKQFLAAGQRKDFELLFSHRRDWSEYIGDEDRILIDGFLNDMNECQFKKEWTEQNYINLKKSVKKINQALV